jgi:putative tryptophan/tyrosine transport system substrate-binding protein
LSEILAHGLLWLDVLRDYHGSIRSHNFRRFVTEAGLISFGIDQAALYRLAASYVDRILKGEKSADLPVQAPTKYETVLNTRLPKHSAWKYRRVCLPVPAR